MLIKSLIRITTAGAVMFAAFDAGATAFETTSQSSFSTLGGNAGSTSVANSVNWAAFAAANNTVANNGSIANNDTAFTSGNQQIKVTSGDSQNMNTYVEGQGTGINATGTPGTGRGASTPIPWNGLFAAGSDLLYTQDGTITLSFATPLIGLGLHAQILNSLGTTSEAYTFTLTAYNSLNQVLGSQMNSGTSNNADGNDKSQEGTAPFAGISTDVQNTPSSLATNGISYVTVTASCTAAVGSTCSTQGFAIDTSLIYHFPLSQQTGGTTTTPEPGTLALLGAGLAALGAVRRRRNRAA